MADEFIKGLGIASAAGLAWMTIAGWYNTHEFGSHQQMFQPAPDSLDVYGQMALFLKDVLLVFGVLGALTFWFLIPALRQYRAAQA